MRLLINLLDKAEIGAAIIDDLLVDIFRFAIIFLLTCIVEYTWIAVSSWKADQHATVYLYANVSLLVFLTTITVDRQTTSQLVNRFISGHKLFTKADN